MSENVYYYPENTGLEVVGHLDRPELSYEFHILGVWKDSKSGKMFWAEDSGCSCPSPFEDFYFKSADDTNLATGMVDLYSTIATFPCAQEDKDQLLKWIQEKL